jgi:hypothetical protein
VAGHVELNPVVSNVVYQRVAHITESRISLLPYHFEKQLINHTTLY